MVGTVVTAVSVANPAAASHTSLQNWMTSQADQLVAELTAKTEETLKVANWGKAIGGKVTAKLDLVLAKKLGLQTSAPAS